MRDQLAGGLETVEDAGSLHGVPAVRECPIDLTVEDPVAAIDETRGVAEGAGVDRGRRRGDGQVEGRLGDGAQFEGSTGRPADRGRELI